MNKKLGIITAAIGIIAMILSIFNTVNSVKQAKEKEAEPPKDTQYVLYLGTNDKDTNEPVFSREDAKVKAEEILVKHFGGYTIQEAEGGWKDGDTVYEEYSLVIYLSDTKPEEVHAAADEMIKTFHQSSVLIQANETVTEFYDGGK